MYAIAKEVARAGIVSYKKSVIKIQEHTGFASILEMGTTLYGAQKRCRRLISYQSGQMNCGIRANDQNPRIIAMNF